jgi:heat shock protein HslJ
MEEFMTKLKTFIVLCMLFTTMVSSCSFVEISTVDELNGTKWKLLYIRKSKPIPGRDITIEFKDGQVHGLSGCNSYFGSYQPNGNEISISQLVSTEMACMDPEGIMQQEQEYLAFLSEVVAFTLEDNQLALKKAIQDQLTFLSE